MKSLRSRKTPAASHFIGRLREFSPCTGFRGRAWLQPCRSGSVVLTLRKPRRVRPPKLWWRKGGAASDPWDDAPFLRYESGNPNYTRVTPEGGLTPGTCCGLASDGPQTQTSLPSTYNLPTPEIPRTVGYPVNPPPGTPVIIQSVAGGTGIEAIFPEGAPPGSVGPPFEVPIDPIP